MTTNSEHRRDSFLEWVKDKVPEKQFKWIGINLDRIDSFCHQRKQIQGSLYEIDDLETLQTLISSIRKDRIFKVSCGKLYPNILSDFELYCHFCMETRKKQPDDDPGIEAAENDAMSDLVREAIRANYQNGLRFDATVLRLLIEQAHIELDETLVQSLQTEMFRRSDGLYFLPEMVCNDVVRSEIKFDIMNKLEQYGLCELNSLFADFSALHPSPCIRTAEDYCDYLLYLMPDCIRAANALGFKIVKRVGVTVNEAVSGMSAKLLASIVEVGCITEDDLLIRYPVLTGTFLRKILEKNTEEVVATTINGIQCYQTIEALGFDDSFPKTLSSVLEKISDLDLVPTEETLHVLLSVEIGQNFMEAFGIPSSLVFRRIISMYYQGETKRVWKAGKFMEE